MKIALVVAGVLVIALLVAARVPKTAAYLQDVPVLEVLVEWIGPHESLPREIELGFDHRPAPEELAHARTVLASRVAPQTVAIRGERLVVTGDDPFAVYQLKLQRPPVRVFTVVYQAPELDALRHTLLRDEQAKHLGLTVELDPIGYHIEAPHDLLYVNDAWATKHHCTGRRIEGTGIPCSLSVKERFDAYVRGDPDLFVEAHPFALPAGRDLYATNLGPIYELESSPTEVPLSRLQFGNGEVLVPLASAPAADTELVVETQPGSLVVGTPRDGRLVIQTNVDLELASLGLRVR